MARVFLDANVLIDLLEKRGQVSRESLNDHEVFISPLSVHISAYMTKRKVPNSELAVIVDDFTITVFDERICSKALQNPTTDFEDNVQLHSAAEADCDFFLTNDKQILNLKFFGKTKIIKDLIVFSL